MFVPMQAQAMLVARCVLLGVAFALFYDVLRALRICFAAKGWQVVLYDSFFWIVLLVVLFEFNLVFAAAQSRYYILAGALGGMLIYFGAFSGLVRPMLQICLNTVISLWKFMTKMSGKLCGQLKKICCALKDKLFTKKIAKYPSIFRRKGIK